MLELLLSSLITSIFGVLFFQVTSVLLQLSQFLSDSESLSLNESDLNAGLFLFCLSLSPPAAVTGMFKVAKLSLSLNLNGSDLAQRLDLSRRAVLSHVPRRLHHVITHHMTSAGRPAGLI